MFKKIKPIIKQIKKKLRSPIVTYEKEGHTYHMSIMNPLRDFSVSNIRTGYQIFHKKINTIYKKDPVAKLDVTSWMFVSYPKLIHKYNLEFDVHKLDLFTKSLKEKGIVKIIYCNGLDVAKVKLKNGETTSIVLKDLPTFILNLGDIKTRNKLKELKIIN
ncbi:MAG: hypothetical protein WCF78_02735 [archaeon]